MPVLLADACPDMPALTLWRHDDYLVDRVGHARLLVRTAPSESATFGDAARLQAGGQQLYEFAEVAAADLLQDLTSSAQPSLYGARIELQVTATCPMTLSRAGTACALRCRRARFPGGGQCTCLRCSLASVLHRMGGCRL